MLRKWIEAIASKIGVSLKSSDYIRTILVRQASYVKGKVKACTGSAKIQQYLQHEWELKLRKQDNDFLEMKGRVESLKEVMDLQQEAAHAAQDMISRRDRKSLLCPYPDINGTYRLKTVCNSYTKEKRKKLQARRKTTHNHTEENL